MNAQVTSNRRAMEGVKNSPHISRQLFVDQLKASNLEIDRLEAELKIELDRANHYRALWQSEVRNRTELETRLLNFEKECRKEAQNMRNISAVLRSTMGTQYSRWPK